MCCYQYFRLLLLLFLGFHSFSFSKALTLLPPGPNSQQLQIIKTNLTLPSHSDNGNLTLPPPTSTTPNPLSFRLAVASAVRSIQAAYPLATLHRIEATSPTIPITRSVRLTDVRLFFSNSLAQPTILLTSVSDAVSWGEWNRPQILSDPRPPDELGLPDVLTRDLSKVEVLVRQSGFRGRFAAVDVVREVFMREPWWVFQMSGRQSGWIWVGDVSGTVEAEMGMKGGTRGRQRRRVHEWEEGIND